MITWNNCFSSKRFGMEDSKDGVRTEYERDWDRIIFSSAFRRLQNKTQVFPLPEEVFVHNRLTHSLEVSSVGRSLGKIVGKELSQLSCISIDEPARKFYRNNLKNVIASACLAHDLGNPAFGHSGEDAISQFFKDRKDKKKFRKLFSEREWADLVAFEGNSNALRILTNQFNGRVSGGFRLTNTTLGSILKYPCESVAGFRKGDDQKHRSKYGFFQIDKDAFMDIVRSLNMIKEEDGDLITFKRHPFTYLVEAADDICYNVIDLEDAHRLGVFSTDYISNVFMELLKLNTSEDFSKIEKTFDLLKDDPNEKIAYLRAKAINFLALRCAEIFLEKKGDILSGNFSGDLLSNIPEAKSIINKIKDISYDKIYNYPSVVKIELAGFRIMSGLVEDFVNASLTPKEERQKRENKVLNLLPNQFKFKEEASPYEKVMCIIDFVSGMSDLFALKLYRNLRGIEMPFI
jgi:dGTPase